MMTVVHRSDERCCDHGPDATNPREPLTGFVRPANAEKPPVEFIEPEIKGAEFFDEWSKSSRVRSKSSAVAMASAACVRKRHAPWGRMTPYSPRSPRI